MVYWITGRSSSGKTVYAKRMKKQFEELGGKVLLLDGDDVRDRFENQEYNDTARLEHIMSIAKFASIVEKQGFIVIISLISPKKLVSAREINKKRGKFRFPLYIKIYLLFFSFNSLAF